MDTYNKDELNRRMNGAVSALKAELAGLRTGRASPASAGSREGRSLWQSDADQSGRHRSARPSPGF